MEITFDQAARSTARRLDALGLLRWLLGEGFWAAWNWTRWLDTQAAALPGGRERRADLIPEFERRGHDAPPVAVVIEFLSEPSGDALERLADYALVFRRGLPYQANPLVKYDVIGVLVNLTGSTDSDEWGMSPTDTGGLGLRLKVGLRNMAKVSAPDTVAGVAAGSLPRALLAWVSLMAGGDSPEVVQEWRRAVEALVDEPQRLEYAAVVLVFANLTDCRAVWEKGLEGWNVKAAPIIQEWTAEAEQKMLRANLLRTLQLRFGANLPADLLRAVEGQTDQAALQRWFDLAVTADSLDRFRTGTGANGA